MNRNTLLAAAAAGVIAIGGAGVFLGQTIFDPHKSEGGARPTSAPAEKEHEGEKAAEGVKMNAEQIASAKIEMVKTEAGSMSGGVETQGSVAAAPEGLAILSARSAGSISAISKRLGDSVGRGETIARIQSGEGAAMAAARASAESRAQVAKSAFEREKRLFDANVTARQDLEAAQEALTKANAELAAARTAMEAAGVSEDGRYVLVRSPIAGRITAARATLGAFVDANAELFRVADPAKIQIETALTAADATRVRPGDTASVLIRDATVKATVRSVTPGLDVASRTATAVLSLPTPDSSLQPGQFVRVHIQTKGNAASPSGVTVPDEAVQSYEGSDVVFVKTADGFEARKVTVGSRSGGRAEILSGLEADQQIAGKNAFILKAELGKSEAAHDD
jgi:cobalt-zinc-cadmium efflux system membrane fusion protein